MNTINTLSFEELKKMFFGVCRFDIIDDYLAFYRCTKEQENLFKDKYEFYYERILSTPSIAIEFTTSAEEFSFDYKIVHLCSYDSLDVYIDDSAYRIFSIKELPREGQIKITMPPSAKKVSVRFPLEAAFIIKNFSIVGDFAPYVKNGKKVIFIGDSITQGYGSSIASHSYVNTVSSILGYNTINHGLSGYVYSKSYITKIEGFYPDGIIVALGTNDHKNPRVKDNISDFYKRLSEVYPSVPVLALTPLWRGDKDVDYEKLEKTRGYITEICGQYSNITVIDGKKLVPCCKQYFLDGVHPSALGSTVYGTNLAKEIQKINWLM